MGNKVLIGVIAVMAIAISAIGYYADETSRKLSYQNDIEVILRDEIVRVKELTGKWSAEGLQFQRDANQLRFRLANSERTVAWYKDYFNEIE